MSLPINDLSGNTSGIDPEKAVYRDGTPNYPFSVIIQGAGSAVSVANGADVAEGSTTDTAYTDVTGAAAGTLVGLYKGQFVATSALSAKLPSTLGAKTGALSLSVVPNTDTPFIIAGSVADNVAPTTNPVYIAALYTSSFSAHTSGRIAVPLTDVYGSLRACITGNTTTLADGLTYANYTTAMAQSGQSGGGPLAVMTALSNATTYDRPRSITGAIADGTGLGVAAVEVAGSLYNNIKTATTTTVKSGKGILHKIVINTIVASATITVYDNTAGSGTTIATITLPATITGDNPFTLEYDLQFTTGCTIVTSGATDITVVYR